jgi:RNA polymerase sigma-70 factor (ECF subfamily)
MAIFTNKHKKYTDEELMQCIQRGDTSAFRELYDRYSKRLLYYFYRELGGDEEKAQDFLQEIFLKVVEKPNLFDVERKFSTWIFTVAYNMCKNEYRRLEVREIVQNNVDMDEVSHLFESEHHDAEENVDQKLFQKALLAELGKFQDGHRSAFVLRYQQSLSIKEIGQILRCSEGTVKSRLFYTTRKLARRLRAFNPYKPEVPKDEKAKRESRYKL